METATTTKPSIQEILNRRRVSSTSPEVTQSSGSGTPETKDIVPTVKAVFRLLAEVEKITAATLTERLTALTRGEAKNRDTQTALQTLAALSVKEDGTKLTGWEAATQPETLRDLRDRVCTRALSRNRRGFETAGTEEINTLVEALTPFRVASKPAEIGFCAREGMAPGPSRLARSGRRGGEIPAEVEETVYCLAQFTIGSIKTSAPKMSKEELEAIRETTVALQNTGRAKPAMPEATLERSKTILATSREETLKLIKDTLMKLNPNEASIAAIDKEIELFASNVEDIGTELDTLDSLHKEEFQFVKSLEAMFDKLDRAKPPEGYNRPSTKEEIQLRIFQGLREIAPTLGKAATVSMAAKLAADEEWLPDFLENGTDALYHAKSYRNHVVITEPENALFGKAEDPERYLQEGETIKEAIGLVDRAENVLYTDPVFSALTMRGREDTLYAANRVCHATLAEGEIERPLIKALSDIRDRADTMAAAISREVDGSERSLEHLPAALRDHEQQTRVSTALARIVQLLASPKVATTIENLLEEEKGVVATLKENPTPDENDRKAMAYCMEKIATLEALRDLGGQASEMEDRSYENLLDVVAHSQVPKSLREHALITLCDNKSANGTRIKTKEILDRLQTLSEVPHLTSRIRKDLSTLRYWKELSITPNRTRRQTLAESICRTPAKLKNAIHKELKGALKSCLITSPWKDPFSVGKKELGEANTAYLVAKSEIAESEPALFIRLRALHSRTADLHKESNGSIWVRAELLAKELRSNEPGSLREREEQALEAILSAKNPAPAIAYMSAWYNTIGNEHILQKETYQAIDEKAYRPEPLPLIAAKIQTRIGNLLEIEKYLSSVASNPEALAETYIQHRLHERRGNPEEAWELRLDRMASKNSAAIENAKKELADWTSKFDAIFEGPEEEDLTDEEIERQSALKTACHRKVGQKERELEGLYLKAERIQELRETSRIINNVAAPNEIMEALRAPSPERFGSLDHALEQALALASSPAKLNLPASQDKTDVTPFQMLEGAHVTQSISYAKGLLESATRILKMHQPELNELDTQSDNPLETARALKSGAFRTLKEVEIHCWESGKSIQLGADTSDYYKENPELAEIRKNWVETLHKAQTEMGGAVEFAATQPQRKPTRVKAKEEHEDPVLA